jgi:hypothetical protein
MKTFIRIFIVLIAIGLSIKAGAQGTTLTIFSEKGENFTVFVNGEMKNSVPGDHVKVEGLHGPTIKLRIAFQDVKIKQIEKTVFNSPSGELFYVVRHGKKDDYILDKTSSDYIHPQEVVKEEPKTAPAQKEETKQTTTKTEAPAKTSGTGCANAMTEGDFQASTIAISNAPFDGIKLTQAKKMVETHCLYSRQIAEVLHILNYDSSKLTLAKDAYKHCYDPENYSDVRDAINSNKSREDLDRYIQSVK